MSSLVLAAALLLAPPDVLVVRNGTDSIVTFTPFLPVEGTKGLTLEPKTLAPGKKASWTIPQGVKLLWVQRPAGATPLLQVGLSGVTPDGTDHDWGFPRSQGMDTTQVVLPTATGQQTLFLVHPVGALANVDDD